MTREDVSAEAAYDKCSPIYDVWNAENDYELWVGNILLPELANRGLARGGCALDVGCGTGRAFEPLLNRGWAVVGCDVSTGMLQAAREKYGAQVRLLNLDARSLPPIAPVSGVVGGEAFQLILLLNDVINYLVDDDDLSRLFSGVRRNLCPEAGLVAFDANTLHLFKDEYQSSSPVQRNGWSWEGQAQKVVPGGIYEARLSGPGIEPHLHRQRHWLPAEIMAAMMDAGLSALAVLGQREDEGGVLLSDVPDESRDAKFIVIGTVRK